MYTSVPNVNRQTKTEQRGVVHAYGYDDLNRLASDAVVNGTTVNGVTYGALPAGVDASVKFIGFSYNDRGQVAMATSASDVAGTTVTNQILNTYTDGQWDKLTRSQQEHGGAVVTGTLALGWSYADGHSGTGNSQYVRLANYSYTNGNQVAYGLWSLPIS